MVYSPQCFVHELVESPQSDILAFVIHHPKALKGFTIEEVAKEINAATDKIDKIDKIVWKLYRLGVIGKYQNQKVGGNAVFFTDTKSDIYKSMIKLEETYKILRNLEDEE